MIYKGVAIPVCWTDLQKKGISSTEEREDLLKKAQSLYGLQGKTLIADREYIGKEWFEALTKAGIDFIVRLKKGIYRQYVDQATGHSYSKLVRKAKKGKRPVDKQIDLEGMGLTFVVVINRQAHAKEEALYLLSSLAKAFSISETYRERWLTECLFKHRKTNGFHLEELGFKDENKIRLLLASLVCCYCLAIHEGLKYDKDLRRNHYKNGSVYRQVSIFRNESDQHRMKLLLIFICLTIQLIPTVGLCSKPRLVISSDFPPIDVIPGTITIGALEKRSDPDDVQSMVRFIVYSNEFEILGLIAASGTLANVASKQHILDIVSVYEKVVGNLKKHDPTFPIADALRKVTKAGLSGTYAKPYEQILGEGKDSEASDYIIRLLKDPSTEPIWFCF